MNRRSRYWGQVCLHCHKPVPEGRVAFASTYYIVPMDDGNHAVTTATQVGSLAVRTGRIPDEFRVRIVYHRLCIEGIIERGPLDPEVEKSMFEQYRESLLQHYEALH